MAVVGDFEVEVEVVLEVVAQCVVQRYFLRSTEFSEIPAIGKLIQVNSVWKEQRHVILRIRHII